jgi:hypothetical protein
LQWNQHWNLFLVFFAINSNCLQWNQYLNVFSIKSALEMFFNFFFNEISTENVFQSRSTSRVCEFCKVCEVCEICKVCSLQRQKLLWGEGTNLLCLQDLLFNLFR